MTSFGTLVHHPYKTKMNHINKVYKYRLREDFLSYCLLVIDRSGSWEEYQKPTSDDGGWWWRKIQRKLTLVIVNRALRMVTRVQSVKAVRNFHLIREIDWLTLIWVRVVRFFTEVFIIISLGCFNVNIKTGSSCWNSLAALTSYLYLSWTEC